MTYSRESEIIASIQRSLDEITKEEIQEQRRQNEGLTPLIKSFQESLDLEWIDQRKDRKRKTHEDQEPSGVRQL